MVLDLTDVGRFAFPASRFGCNVIFFGVDMSSSVHIDNKMALH